VTWDQFNAAFFCKWLAATSLSLRQKARKLAEFRSFPYGPMCDEAQVTLTSAEHDLWLEYIDGFIGTCILGSRNVLDELCQGPVRILKTGVESEYAIQLTRSSGK
jgi:hypothetical protein